MQLILRPPAPRFHPLMRPMSRRGFAGLGQTCQVPQPGVPQVYPACPSSAPISSGTPAATYTGQPGPAVYVAPPSIPNPPCSSDPNPWVANSAACIAQLQAIQQQRFQLANNANFQVDYANCVAGGTDPAVCATRTFGLTPAGGYTSDAGGGPGGTPLILDAQGRPVSGVPVYTGPPLPGMTPGGPAGQPSLTFTNLTSGNNSKLVAGDRWQLQISGAQPNAAVSVTGGKDGQSATTPQGNTDSSGSRTYNGQVDASEIGSWNEQWSVGGQVVGTVAFTVSPATPTGGGGTPPPTGGTGKGGTGAGGTGGGGTGTGSGTVPVWAIAITGLVGFFLLMRVME